MKAMHIIFHFPFSLCALAAVVFYLTELKTAVIIQHFAVIQVMFSFWLSSVNIHAHKYCCNAQ